MAALPTYIPLVEAARRMNVDDSQLQLLVESGKIRAAQLPDGNIMVDESEVKKGTGDLPKYILLEDAVKRYDLDANLLARLVERGDLAAITAPDGDILVDERDIRKLAARPKKEDLPEYKQYAHLRGQPIWISEAARKYNLVAPTITGWVKAGYIAILGRDGQKVLLDEADVAYCAEINRKRGGQGKRVFNIDGTPYTPKSARNRY